MNYIKDFLREVSIMDVLAYLWYWGRYVLLFLLGISPAVHTLIHYFSLVPWPNSPSFYEFSIYIGWAEIVVICSFFILLIIKMIVEGVGTLNEWSESRLKK